MNAIGGITESQSFSSIARVAAGAFGFLILIRVFDVWPSLLNLTRLSGNEHRFDRLAADGVVEAQSYIRIGAAY